MSASAAWGAHYWILPAFAVFQPESSAPVVEVQNVASVKAAEETPEVSVARLEAAPPPAPQSLARPAISSPDLEIARSEWQPTEVEPYDPADDLEAALVPFPTKPEPESKPQVAKSKPKPTNRQTARPAASRAQSSPKPAARGPSRPARDLKRVPPSYPRSARRSGAEGRVVLNVEVRADGRVGSVGVFSSSGSRALDSSAIAAVKRWRFSPELKNGQPVSSTLRVPFSFVLE